MNVIWIVTDCIGGDCPVAAYKDEQMAIQHAKAISLRDDTDDGYLYYRPVELRTELPSAEVLARQKDDDLCDTAESILRT